MGEIVYLKRRAKPEDYEQKKAGVWVLSFAERLGPGVITHDPHQGSEEYNKFLECFQENTKKNQHDTDCIFSLLQETLESQDINLFQQLSAKYFLSAANSYMLNQLDKKALLSLPEDQVKRITLIFYNPNTVRFLLTDQLLDRLKNKYVKFL